MEYICPDCNEKRTIEDFEWRNDKNGIRSECKFCHYARIKECKVKSPEKYKETN